MGWRRFGTDSVVVFRIVMMMAEVVVLEVTLDGDGGGNGVAVGGGGIDFGGGIGGVGGRWSDNRDGI